MLYGSCLEVRVGAVMQARAFVSAFSPRALRDCAPAPVGTTITGGRGGGLTPGRSGAISRLTKLALQALGRGCPQTPVASAAQSRWPEHSAVILSRRPDQGAQSDSPNEPREEKGRLTHALPGERRVQPMRVPGAFPGAILLCLYLP